jgi:gliding motility-associated-like protein
MRPVPDKILLPFILLYILAGQLRMSAQISSTTDDFAGTLDYYDSLKYIVPLKTDPYFVFFAPEPGAEVTGSLTASNPGGTTGNFSWSRYDPVSNSFMPAFQTDTGVASSNVNNLGLGCYRVNITSDGPDTVLRAWVFPNDPIVEVEKGPDGKVKPYQYTCDLLRLIGRAVADTMPYYDLNSGRSLILSNGMEFEWTCDDPDYRIYGASVNQTLFIYNQPPDSRPPVKDTRFFLTAVDSFNLTRTDEVLYESIHVKAGFKMWFEERSGDGGGGIWTESLNPEEESPLEIRFLNDSENGVEFIWTLVDSAKTGEDATFITDDVNDSLSFTYYVPGYYYPSMYAKSEAGCVDSFPLGEKPEVHVLPSELDVPNVFTPNGDGVNDFFVVRARSLKTFRITIFAPTGRKIYEYSHTDGRMEWEGWDGSIHGKGGRFAEPGIYYYVIDAIGWDATVYHKREPYTGFVYLFREPE